MKRFLEIYLCIFAVVSFLSLLGCMVYKAYLEGQLLAMAGLFFLVFLPIFLWLAEEHGGR